MTENDLAEILKRNHLSVTGGRIKILDFFKRSNKALSHADIEKYMGQDSDRVTIYRTLQSFSQRGLIHHIPTADTAMLYAVCREDCGQGHHHDRHVHFMCDHCGITYCLYDAVIPQITLPEGFAAKQTDMVVSGKCANCT